jgi:hypothetical protein
MPSGEQNLNRLLLYYTGSTGENHCQGDSGWQLDEMEKSHSYSRLETATVVVN